MTTEAIISPNIFNSQKTDYDIPSLFMGQQLGLLDTINKPYPQLTVLYKKMKSLDWDELEFDFGPCNAQFKSCPKSVSEMMIISLAYQWAQDTSAARSIIPITAPFLSSTELFETWARVADNESVHALTYSEIVRSSFDNPTEVMGKILSISEVIGRMEGVSAVFEKAYQTSHKLALGMVEKNQETYNDIFMFVVALYIMERLQFMASFAVTFAIVDTGIFNPIGAAVQKICQDELEVHSEVDKAVLDIEMRTDMGIMAFNQCREKIITLLEEAVASEMRWLDFLHSEGRELAGVTKEQFQKWVLFNVKPIYEFFRIKPAMELPAKNPLPYMEEWMDISQIQRSPQEEKSGGYLLGGVVTTDTGVKYDDDF
jgi:ribonucleoside-diphosphate reductase beta chain